jgi:hypothetical protein
VLYVRALIVHKNRVNDSSVGLAGGGECESAQNTNIYCANALACSLPFTASTKPLRPFPPLPLLSHCSPQSQSQIRHTAPTTLSFKHSVSPTPLLSSATTHRPASQLAARLVYQEKSSSTLHDTCGFRLQRRIVQEGSLSFLSCQSTYPGERCNLLPDQKLAHFSASRC